MTWVQLHLAANHLPVIGLPLLLLLLAVATFRHSRELQHLILWSLLGLCTLSIAVKFTGDFAWEENPGLFAGSKSYVERHEQAADQATTGVFLMGCAAAVALFLARGQRPIRGWSLVLVLLLGLATSFLYFRTGHTGGKIQHPELRGTN